MTPEERAQLIKELQEDLAAQRAWVDQRQKQFDGQYDRWMPFINQKRLDDLEVWKFEIEIAEWELQQLMDEDNDG